MSRYAPTPEVMAIGQINISGNVTPAGTVANSRW